jgi:hypothetical protein
MMILFMEKKGENDYGEGFLDVPKNTPPHPKKEENDYGEGA